MSDVQAVPPPDAVTLAAARALHEAACSDESCAAEDHLAVDLGISGDWDLAVAALAAAAPVLETEADARLATAVVIEGQRWQEQVTNLRHALKEAGKEMDRRYEMGATTARQRIREQLRDKAAEYRDRSLKAPTVPDSAFMIAVGAELDAVAHLLDGPPSWRG